MTMKDNMRGFALNPDVAPSSASTSSTAPRVATVHLTGNDELRGKGQSMRKQQDVVRTIVTAGAVVALLAFALLAGAGGGIDFPGNGGPSISPPETPVEPTPPPSTPATGMYARFDGVEGESVDDNHKDWIDLDSFSWGLHKAMVGATGQTRRSGVTTVEDIVVTKKLDKASPKLAEALSNGEIFKEVEIHLCASYGFGGSQTFVVYKLKNVMVSSYEVGGSAWGDAVPTESISLNFEEVKQTYVEYDASGTPQGQTQCDLDVTQDTAGQKSGSDAG
jgi:type VI secretion system secreted protein Hcp